jgi:hypothetical protein
LRTAASLIIVALLSQGCRRKDPPVAYSAAPDHVITSFTAFADSVIPQLAHTIESGGYHVNENPAGDTLLVAHSSVHVDELNSQESAAKIYGASITLNFYSDLSGPGSYRMPENLFLEFKSAGAGTKWALLTKDGYLFELVSNSGRSDLPLDIQTSIRNLFSDHIEVASWWGFQEAQLAKVRGRAAHSD